MHSSGTGPVTFFWALTSLEGHISRLGGTSRDLGARLRNEWHRACYFLLGTNLAWGAHFSLRGHKPWCGGTAPKCPLVAPGLYLQIDWLIGASLSSYHEKATVRYALDESAPVRSWPFSKLSGWRFDFFLSRESDCALCFRRIRTR